MTGFDRSLAALTRPESAARFFSADIGLPQAAPVVDFDLAMAWWLGELSRVVYIRHIGEYSGPSGARDRQYWLSSVGLEERGAVEISSGHVGAVIVDAREPGGAAPQARYIVFRGTDSPEDWLKNFLAVPIPFDNHGRAHAGFTGIIDAMWPELTSYLRTTQLPLYITGHSQGGALAALCFLRAHWQHIGAAGCYTFGAPLIADAQLAGAARALPVYCIANHRDVVTQLPIDVGPVTWHHVGATRYFDGRGRVYESDPNPRSSPLPGRRDWRRWRAGITQLSKRLRSEQGFEIPEFLSDHAPVNYVARIEQSMLQSGPP